MLLQNKNRRSYIERFTVMLLAALFTVYLVSCSQEQKGPPKPKARPTVSADTTQTTKSKIDIHKAVAVIETAKGAIEVEFFADVAPKTVENFLKNARLEYYNHGKFHRVEPGKLIQAGSRFPIEDTIAIETSERAPVRGILAMAKEEGDIHNAIAVIETAKGAIEVEFFADVAPKTVENFLKNARLEYYNHGKFHRVEPGKLIQAGSRFPIEDTIAIETSERAPVRGILAMAKEEGATVADATQFFICLDTIILDSDYTLFGQVTKGLDVIDSIAVGDQIVTVKIREKG